MNAIAVATAAASLTILLPIILGVTAPLLQDALGLGETQVGALASSFFAVSTLAVGISGTIVDRTSHRKTMRIGIGLVAVSCFGVAAFPRATPLLAAMLIGGAANALVQPSVNVILLREVRADRLGLGFGIKQAAVPLAGIIAGTFVPVLATRVGWHSSYLVVGVVALAFMFLTYQPDLLVNDRFVVQDNGFHRSGRRLRDGTPSKRALWPLSVGFLFGSWSVSTLSVFGVYTMVRRGTELPAAGAVFAMANVAGAISRVGLGWWADLTNRSSLRTVILMLVGGAGIIVLLGVLEGPPLLVCFVLACAVGWGWNGLFSFSVVRAFSLYPGRASGVVLTGGLAGSTLGPVIFGMLAERASLLAAWAASSCVGVLAAFLIARGRRVILTSRE